MAEARRELGQQTIAEYAKQWRPRRRRMTEYSTGRHVDSSVNVHVVPRLGSRKLNSVTPIVVVMMVGCGLRNGEARAVNINNVVSDDVYRVHEQIHSNTHRPGEVEASQGGGVPRGSSALLGAGSDGAVRGEARHHEGRLSAARSKRLLHGADGTPPCAEALQGPPGGGRCRHVQLPALLRLERAWERDSDHRRGGMDGPQPGSITKAARLVRQGFGPWSISACAMCCWAGPSRTGAVIGSATSWIPPGASPVCRARPPGSDVRAAAPGRPLRQSVALWPSAVTESQWNRSDAVEAEAVAAVRSAAAPSPGDDAARRRGGAVRGAGRCSTRLCWNTSPAGPPRRPGSSPPGSTARATDCRSRDAAER